MSTTLQDSSATDEGDRSAGRALVPPGRRCSSLLAIGLAILVCGRGLAAADWFASPDGKSTNTGTLDSPWDLASALSGTKPVRPGDTVRLRAGTYTNPRSEFTIRFSGEPARPITVRNCHNERATIDGMLTVNGNDIWVWGLEVLVSEPRPDKPLSPGSSPADLKRPWGGIQSNTGQRSKIINCIVHDNDQGFGYWLGATDAEIYGCLIYQNGWVGTDRTHGHAIYTQNDQGTKLILDNIMFDPYSYLLHAYGSNRAFVNGYHVEGNIFFGGPVLIGGGKPSERIVFVNNYTYRAPVQFGYTAPHNMDVVCTGNYLAGGLSVNKYHKVTVSGNELVAGAKADFVPPTDGQPTEFRWDNNRYVSASSAALDAWRAKTGFDKDSTFLAAKDGRPQSTKIVLRPNKYEPGRANAAVYNWEGKAEVDLDLSSILKIGQAFEVRNVQDYFGTPGASGTYRGGTVSVPLLRGGKKTLLKLSGDPSGRVWHTFGDYPDVDAFVVLPQW